MRLRTVRCCDATTVHVFRQWLAPAKAFSPNGHWSPRFLCMACSQTLRKTTHFPAVFAIIVAAAAALLLLVGLWTPSLEGALALSNSALPVSQISDPLLSVILATLGGTLAMIGPGGLVD